MVRPASDIQSIQRQFQDVHTLLMNVVDALSRNGNPIVSTAIQDVTRVSEKVRKLELGVNEHAKVRQSQLGALMGIGRVINSSRGLQKVLEEVMDTLIALMRDQAPPTGVDLVVAKPITLVRLRAAIAQVVTAQQPHPDASGRQAA